MNSKADKKNSTFVGWTNQQKNKYLDRIKIISFKEREKEIIARLKNKTISSTCDSKVIKTDDNIFWNKELKKLEIEKKCLQRRLSPIEFHGLYKHHINVIFINLVANFSKGDGFIC
jgi:hypothetical protein